MNIFPLTRGNDKLGEPDYMCAEDGYEVTFAINKSLIPQLKGVQPLDGNKSNIEESLIAAITEAIERKVAKTYSCVPSLVILTIATLPTWYHPLYFHSDDPFVKMAWKVHTVKRDKLFHDLYDAYIRTNKLKNILIIQPTFNGTFAFYNICEFAENSENFLIHVNVSNPNAYPTYRIVDAENMYNVNDLKIIVVNYTIGS